MRQIDVLFEYLKKYGSITGMEAITKLGILNYKGRISDLRQAGIDIETVFEEAINSDGERKRFARYYYHA